MKSGAYLFAPTLSFFAAPLMTPRTSSSFMMRKSSPSSLISVPEYLPNKMQSPSLTARGKGRRRTEGNREQEQPPAFSGACPASTSSLARAHAYRSDEDWIFASPHYGGKTPYTYQILFRRHIRPLMEKISGIKSSKEAPIGWHTLRRSLATLLVSNGENVKVAQSQLRHTTPKITLELYAQAVSADQQEAHKKVVQMVLPARFPERLKERSATATA